MSIFWACFACSYADEKISSSDNTRFFISFSSGSLTSHGSPSLLSFEALSDLCVQVNDDLANGVFGSSRKNISCKLSSFSVGGEIYWGISLANPGLIDFWYCNGSLGVFYSRANTDSLLSLISNYASTISYYFNNLMANNGFLRGFSNSLDSIASLSSNISSYFNNLMADNGFLRGFYISLDSIDSLSSNISSQFNNLMADNGFLRGFSNSFNFIESRLDTILGKMDSSSGSDLTTLETSVANIGSTLSIINDKLDNTATSIENTTVNISNNNPAYNVFYVTDENGEEHSITSVAADSLSASGKLLQFLYKLVVDGALSGVDSAVDGLNDFFFDSSPGSIVEGGSVWD